MYSFVEIYTFFNTNSIISIHYILNSCVTCILKIVQNMANFISPFLTRILYVSCSLSSLISAASRDNQTNSSHAYPQIELKLNQLRFSMATLIPLRLMAPILNDQSDFTVQTTPGKYRITAKNIEYYMQMV